MYFPEEGIPDQIGGVIEKDHFLAAVEGCYFSSLESSLGKI